MDGFVFNKIARKVVGTSEETFVIVGGANGMCIEEICRFGKIAQILKKLYDVSAKVTKFGENSTLH